MGTRVTRILLTAIAGGLILSLAASSPSHARPTWQTAEASYYTLYGNHTACGKVMNRWAWHVSALTREHAHCGRKLTICNRPRRRCVHVTVQDSGAPRTDGRLWDLTPRVRNALHCGPLCHVHWHIGYTRP